MGQTPEERLIKVSVDFGQARSARSTRQLSIYGNRTRFSRQIADFCDDAVRIDGVGSLMTDVSIHALKSQHKIVLSIQRKLFRQMLSAQQKICREIAR
ncbi:hypothetical protein BJF93_23325 [Xaviernesmea oryzae]|uniref:Uncharacterized protein n=1 Tax=Xaviernesmea oryzae TaxID=464029 RepID=A0A1Q9B2R6_9HYPH|nr:hypothetical protein [Xaviernesmea oryzae]OLP62298.1 hypothetical protein BJF93_23325 [Xaviernesmea oryzae]